ncbi:MAG TPA: tRNA 2-thiouridine(34) synthase MnmA [Bdellovibrionota bacterium]|nr:tRNA 2-thiouridine(34) synthase MnmA [Bdellovibrionota bacterium]
MLVGRKDRVVVAMSGGVDSSVAALLLVRAGYDVVGISMRLWSYEREATHGCCTPEDLQDARKVADLLGIPHYVANFEKTFERHVIDNFVQSYQVGETPNPCIRCNQDVKFSTLLVRAKELGAQYLATGHYARKEKVGGRYQLLRAVEQSRDQSYFLYGVTQEELKMLLFPIGHLPKSEVRRLATEAGLPVADKQDSQEICFVPDDYVSFVEKKVESQNRCPGRLVSEAGEELGRHEGIHRFTVGQRKGLGLPALQARYVLDVRSDGTVVVGSEADLYKCQFELREPRWVENAPQEGENFDVKIRSRFEPASAKVETVMDGRIVVRFASPQRAITPGQAAVFYRGDAVVGGGWIDRVLG